MSVFTDKHIKVGRINTVIFYGDCIRHVVGENSQGEPIDTIIFEGSDNRNIEKMDMDSFLRMAIEWGNEDVNRKSLHYFIPIGQKCSKKFFNMWKKLGNIEVTETFSASGNKITKYTYAKS